MFKTSHSPSPGEVAPDWKALEMPNHTSGGKFNPFDVEVPDVPTIKIHGSVEVITGEATEYTFEHAAVGSLDRIFPLFPGFGGVELSSGPFRNAMARLDMPTLTVEPVRKDDRSFWERLTDPQTVHIETMEAALEDLQQQTDIKLGKGEDETAAVILAHSMGGDAALRYAEKHHLSTEAVILLATIGFGSPNILEIAKKILPGLPPSIREEIIPFLKSDEVEFSFSSLKKALGYYVVNPVRTVGEIGSCLTSKQKERTHRLRELGIRTVYGQPIYDLLVQGIDGASEAVDVIGEIGRAGHMFVQAKPGRAAHWVRGAIDTIELPSAA